MFEKIGIGKNIKYGVEIGWNLTGVAIWRARNLILDPIKFAPLRFLLFEDFQLQLRCGVSAKELTQLLHIEDA